MTTTNKLMTTMILAGAMLAAPAMSGAEPGRTTERMAQKIRRELVMMPFLSVFDNLSFRVDEQGLVTLSGQVIRPTLRTDAERLAQRVEGVVGVKNEIEVLPLSPNDDRIRLAVLRAVYGNVALNRYALNPNPPIRIIVKQGTVTLEGVVANDRDRDIANIQANGVFGVFSVKNNLKVERRQA